MQPYKDVIHISSFFPCSYWRMKLWRGLWRSKTTSAILGTESIRRCTSCWRSPSYSDTCWPTTITLSGRETSTPSTLLCSTCVFCSFTSSKRDLDRKSSWFVEWYSLLCSALQLTQIQNIISMLFVYNKSAFQDLHIFKVPTHDGIQFSILYSTSTDIKSI